MADAASVGSDAGSIRHDVSARMLAASATMRRGASKSCREFKQSKMEKSSRKSSRSKLALFVFLGIVIAYLSIAYIALPLAWFGYIRLHPAIGDTPGVTTTSDGHPGDPINVALIGSEADLKRVMQSASWLMADPLGLKDDLKIAEDTVLEHPYGKAPVSNLFLWGRKEDFAFEQPVGDDPRKRHHVRFWKSSKLDANLQITWMGSASYDKHVGLSHTTGQITHHIAADVDTERDHLFETLKETGGLAGEEIVDNFHTVLEGHNGGGDPWYTDGRLFTGTLKSDNRPVLLPSDRTIEKSESPNEPQR